MEKLEEAISPLLEEGGYELVMSSFFGTPTGWVLRFLIDREGGITLGECAKLLKEFRLIIAAESIPELEAHNYIFEVSSPGVERPLTKTAHFVKFVGHKIRLKTLSSLRGLDPNRKNFCGELLKCSDGEVSLRLEDQSIVSILLDNIEKANLVYEGEKKNEDNWRIKHDRRKSNKGY